MPPASNNKALPSACCLAEPLPSTNTRWHAPAKSIEIGCVRCFPEPLHLFRHTLDSYPIQGFLKLARRRGGGGGRQIYLQGLQLSGGRIQVSFEAERPVHRCRVVALWDLVDLEAFQPGVCGVQHCAGFVLESSPAQVTGAADMTS